MTRLMSLPLEVSKPVLSASPIQHLTGGLGTELVIPQLVSNCKNYSGCHSKKTVANGGKTIDIDC